VPDGHTHGHESDSDRHREHHLVRDHRTDGVRAAVGGIGAVPGPGEDHTGGAADQRGAQRTVLRRGIDGTESDDGVEEKEGRGPGPDENPSAVTAEGQAEERTGADHEVVDTVVVGETRRVGRRRRGDGGRVRCRREARDPLSTVLP